MSRTFDALQRAESVRHREGDGRRRADRPFRVVTVTSNKGGVGKTTIATNLAVYLRALSEDLPILVVGLDDQPMIDRMFAPASPEAAEAVRSIADGLRGGSLEGAIRLGQYGVHYVPTSREVSDLKHEIGTLGLLEEVLGRTGWRGLVIVDTKSDFEALTRSAVAAADLTLVVVKDHASLLEAERVFELFRLWRRPFDEARIVLSLVDLRIRFKDGAVTDVLSLLLQEIRRHGYPLFESFLSRSPKVESLYTNPSGRALSILHHAQGTPVHKQMHELAAEVMDALVVPSLLGGDGAMATEAFAADDADAPEDALGAMKRWLLFGPGGARSGGPSGLGD